MSYTVKELIEQLTDLQTQLGPDTVVVVSRDAEGNAFHKLADAEESWAIDPDEYEVELVHSEDYETEYDEEERADFVKVVVLWP